MDKYKKMKLLDGLEEITFNKDDVIIKENEHGESFYIIEDGEVACTKFDEASGTEKFVRNLGPGDYFGELALVNDVSKRTLSVWATAEKVKCLAISRWAFSMCLFEFRDELKKKDYFVLSVQ